MQQQVTGLDSSPLVKQTDMTKGHGCNETIEDQLRRELFFKNALLEHMHEGVIVCNEEGKLTLFNATARAWHGYSESDDCMESWSERYSLFDIEGDEMLQTESIPLVRAFRGESFLSAGMSIKLDDKPLRKLHADGFPLRYSDGKILGAMVVMRDVTKQLDDEQRLRALNNDLERLVLERTASVEMINSELEETNAVLEEEIEERERKDFELVQMNKELDSRVQERTSSLETTIKELQTSNTLLRAVLESSTDVAIFALNAECEYIAFNKRHADVMKNAFDIDIEIGMSIYDVIRNDAYRLLKQNAFARALAGEIFTLHEDSPHHGSPHHYWQDIWSPIRDEEGAIIGLTCFAMDVTERQTIKRALEKSELKYKTIHEQSPIGIALVMSDSGIIVEANQRFYEILQRTEKDFSSTTWMSITHEDDLDEDIRLLNQLKAGEIDEYAIEKRYILPCGEYIWAKIHVAHIRNLDNHEKQHVCLIEDITARKCNEARLVQALERADAANAAKSQFLANMSHEIRTPLNGMLGMLQLTELTPLSDEQKNYLAVATQSSNHLLKILNDILDYSKIEAGYIELHNDWFDLKKTVGEVLDLFRAAAHDKRIALSFSYENHVPKMVLGDSLRLRQVLMNLVGNAVKFTHQGSVCVKIACVEDAMKPAHLKFCVSDTGIGIAAEHMDRLFDSFMQVDNSNTRRYGGTGLGLAITKRIIQLMDGNIHVESEFGKGSEFCFDIVFEQVEQPSDPVDTILVETHTKANMSELILVVDDDETNRDVMENILSRWGYRVITVEDGQKCLSVVKKEDVALILMDVNMPFLDGYTTTGIIRMRQEKHIPIIAMTANALYGDREKCIESGMDDYISKPFSFDDIKEKIEKNISRNA